MIKFNIKGKTEPESNATTCPYLEVFQQWKAVLKMVTKSFEGISRTGSSEMFAILNIWCKTVGSRATLEKVITSVLFTFQVQLGK
jgi:hypothetical protein